MSTYPANPAGVRVVELPPCVMLTSKGRSIEEFDEHWSALDRQRSDRFFPRDFMYFDEAEIELVWLYACEERHLEGAGFGRVEFPGGLYAACTSRDRDEEDGERVLSLIKRWVVEGGAFEVDEGGGRYPLFHVITPERAFEKMGYRQLDIYLPIS